ncbi:glycoside hydrolase family 43 protein [Duganella zoogloeoides]|uniref:Glycoside hydrolase family 43 protein n=1 Tax=Duganella zoogloeoides TaxID=75659 RepID=A0ABZ0XXL0_9BURK|nr:glycoside hydrolase family 43 protein [Duganella zoogloeoides]WQH03941.1 glycoside hydrolase family 43 protein [Duganella zoogloeoides]
MLAVLMVLGSAAAQAGNPLVTDKFTADPATLVDNGRVYLYAGRDEALPPPEGTKYVMNEWLVYSTCDMQNWTAHGTALRYDVFAWAGGSAWASDIIKRDGKYWFFATVTERSAKAKAIGVAVADSPLGPFRDAIGKPLITNSMTLQTDIGWDDIDPGVFIDDDGQAWMFWGNQVLKYAKIKRNMIELDSQIYTDGLPQFTEAPYVHKRNGIYYLSYSRDWPEYTVYSTSDKITGPWRYRGKIMDKNLKTGTVHHAFVEFNGKSYIVYHNAELPSGGEYRRSVAVEEFTYNADGTIPFIAQTTAGPAANPTAACKPQASAQARQG